MCWQFKGQSIAFQRRTEERCFSCAVGEKESVRNLAIVVISSSQQTLPAVTGFVATVCPCKLVDWYRGYGATTDVCT
jgi:hypothetical protein